MRGKERCNEARASARRERAAWAARTVEVVVIAAVVVVVVWAYFESFVVVLTRGAGVQGSDMDEVSWTVAYPSVNFALASVSKHGYSVMMRLFR